MQNGIFNTGPALTCAVVTSGGLTFTELAIWGIGTNEHQLWYSTQLTVGGYQGFTPFGSQTFDQFAVASAASYPSAGSPNYQSQVRLGSVIGTNIDTATATSP